MNHAAGIIAKPRKDEVSRIVPRIIETLQRHKLDVFLDTETASCLSPAQFQSDRVLTREQMAPRVDWLMVLGGDGTLLAAARALGDVDIPILPINLGSLGFLASVTLEDLFPSLEEVLEGRHRISQRILLQADVIRKGKVVQSHRALNEIVLNKGALAR